jgi:hypothetical protein
VRAADVPPRPEQEPGDPCGHENVRVEAGVNAFEDRRGEWTADIRIACNLCGVPFKFLGLPAGVSFLHPTVSIDSRELRVPIVPDPGPATLHDRATFSLARRDS